MITYCISIETGGTQVPVGTITGKRSNEACFLTDCYPKDLQEGLLHRFFTLIRMIISVYWAVHGQTGKRVLSYCVRRV